MSRKQLDLNKLQCHIILLNLYQCTMKQLLSGQPVQVTCLHLNIFVRKLILAVMNKFPMLKKNLEYICLCLLF